MPDVIEFVVNGQPLSLSHQAVVEAIKGVPRSAYGATSSRWQARDTPSNRCLRPRPDSTGLTSLAR